MVAEDGRQQVRGVAVVALQGRAVADADDGLLLVLLAEDRLERAGAADRNGLPGGRARPRQPPQWLVGQLDELVPVGLAGEAQDDVGRAVPLGEVVAHLVGLQRGDRFDGAEDAVAQRVLAEVGGLGGLVGDRHRVVQVHPDLFDDHLLLGLEVVLAEGGPEDVGQDVEGRRQVLGQAGDVVERVFLGGLRVVLGPDAVEVAVDGQGVAAGRPLEGHVLEEVRDAGQLVGLVAAPRLDEEAGGDRVRLVVQLGDDLEPVVQRRVMKSSWVPTVGRSGKG